MKDKVLKVMHEVFSSFYPCTLEFEDNGGDSAFYLAHITVLRPFHPRVEKRSEKFQIYIRPTKPYYIEIIMQNGHEYKDLASKMVRELEELRK